MNELLQKIAPKTFLLSMGGIVLLVAAGLFFSMILPQFKDYRASVHSRELLETVARTSGQLDQQLIAVEQAVERLGRQLHGDMMGLPEKQLEGFIIGRLQEISWRHGIELVGVRPGRGKKVQIFQELLFDVEVSGEYFAFFDWLREVGKELGFVVVKHYVIRPIETNKPNPRLSVNLTMVSYRKV
ncbi:MAG: type 4a pilus biogenesis protein PilO [Gammaproteobacteria bacterium]